MHVSLIKNIPASLPELPAMSDQIFTAGAIAAFSIALFLAMKFLGSSKPSSTAKLGVPLKADEVPDSVKNIVTKLRSKLPEEVVLSRDAATNSSAAGHWAQQECERTPGYIVQPRSSSDVRFIVSAIKNEFAQQSVVELSAGPDGQLSTASTGNSGLFAIRGGGHSAIAGAASIQGGLLIDLSRLKEVQISKERTTVSVGAGCRWADVSTLLDREGLAAVGGRNSHVGVGGLTLGGGLSFFSPRYGLVCSNVVEYEIVLASGDLTTASESNNPDLWKALKGGANNFGIVTRFTLRCFPSPGVWAGFLYMPGNKSTKVLAAFHEAVAKADPSLPTRDVYAAGPIACFTYLQGVPFQVISVSLVYTTIDEKDGSKWPAYWKSSSFASIWRLWSTVKARTLTNSTDEMNTLNPPGRRQVLAATTIKNDPATLDAAYAAYKNAQTSIRRVKGISWTMVMQPLVPEWARKGDPNPLGLDEGSSEPLVVVSFTVNWGDAKDDAFASSETRRALDQIEKFAEEHGTAHRYRYLNYCGEWQHPFKGYGQENVEFLRKVSKKYDPDGIFQTGCTGGFKLWD